MRALCWEPQHCPGGGGGWPLPERTVFKQGALAPRHGAAATAAATVIVTLGVAREALASTRHAEVGWGPFP